MLQAELAEYHKLGLDIAQVEKRIMSEITRPERILLYLVPGRLVCFQHTIVFFFGLLILQLYLVAFTFSPC